MIAKMPSNDQPRISKVSKLALITLFSGVIFSATAFYFSDRKPLMIGDSAQYARMAANLFNHQVLSLENHEADKPFYPTIARMPGYPFLLGAINQLVGESDWNILVLNLTAYLMSCLIITIMAHQLFGFFPAVITAILTTSHFSSLYYAMTGLSESSANFLIIGLILIYQIHKKSNRIRTLALMGLVSGVAGLYREPVLPILVIGFITFGVDWNSSFRMNIQKVVVFGFCMLAGYSPWIYRNYRLSNQFIPVTIYGKGVNYVRIFQDHGDLSLLFTLSDWKKVIELDKALMSIVNHKTGYPYQILFGNPEKQQPTTNTSLIPDLDKYFPNEMYEYLANDPLMAPTIKCELLYCNFMINATKPMTRNIPYSRKAKNTLIRLFHLYSCNDMTQYSSVNRNYIHKLMQFRWYCLECPLALIGMICGLTHKKSLPYLAFIMLYSILIISKMHIEPRYAYLPILFIKIFMGYGLYTIAILLKTRVVQFRSVSQA